MKIVIRILVLMIGFLVLGSSMYNRGLADGVARYKQSNEFALTLESQYHFGYLACQTGEPE